MATYILVPGAWHGSWCWSELLPLLESAGHHVLTPDLLGTSLCEQALIEEPLRFWADQIAAIVQEQREPVTLVGHSRAGVVISEVAERVPERIRHLIFVSAYVATDGQSINDLARRASNFDSFAEAVDFHANGTCTVKPANIEDFFYNRTPAPLARFGGERLVPEPVAAFMTPVHVTKERFGSIAKAYIECTDDHAIPIADQRVMRKAAGIPVVETLNSDHSPFFSDPHTLFAAIERVSNARTAE